jgi:hypothetical protein
MTYQQGPTRPHGKILAIDEDPATAWADRFNRKLSIGAAAMVAAIGIFYGISCL